MDALVEEPQKTLFNINTKEINPDWIDPMQPLRVPVDPLHFQAHKLQLLLARMEVQAKNNPAQFNSANYLSTLEKFTSLCEAINKGKTVDEVLEQGKLAGIRDESAAGEVGNPTSPSLGTGVSADNPLAG